MDGQRRDGPYRRGVDDRRRDDPSGVDDRWHDDPSSGVDDRWHADPSRGVDDRWRGDQGSGVDDRWSSDQAHGAHVTGGMTHVDDQWSDGLNEWCKRPAAR